MNLAARYRVKTYREYVDIAPTGVSTQPPPPEFPSPCQILCLDPENLTTPLDGQMFCKFTHFFVSPVYKMVYLTIVN